MSNKFIAANMQLPQALGPISHIHRVAGYISRLLLVIALAIVCIHSATAQTPAGTTLNNLNKDGVILDGYDPVAYFTDNKPVKGDPQFAYKYDDAGYHFALQEHLDLFKANPEKYKPQFGAWCAYAVSFGSVAPISVNSFSIVNDRLFLQHNKSALAGWSKDVPGNIIKADKYWPTIQAGGGK